MKKINDMLTVGETCAELVLTKRYRAAYGFGEKYNAVNQKGNFVRACVREKCFDQGEYTYCSMPFFLTPDGFGIYVDTYVEVDFDFRQRDKIVLSFARESDGSVADVYLFEGTPKEILFGFRSLVGMPRIFPRWALGAYMSANRWRTQAEIEEQRTLTKRYGFPHNVIVAEPWSDLTTHVLFNGSTLSSEGEQREEYTLADISFGAPWEDPKRLIDDLHADGLHLLLWIVPIYAQGVNLETGWNTALCLRENETVKARKECVQNADGTPYEIPHTWCVGSMVPDFTDPAAKRHWFGRLRYLKELGVDGFKTDGGEFIHDRTVRFSDGTTGLEGQNRYCEDYTSAFAEFVGEEGILFSRAGGQRCPSHTVIWAGDQESTWAEFRSVLRAGLSAGLSGIHLWGFDIAGFSGYLPSEELYLRAVQTAAFAPVMQWHSDPVSNGRCDFTGAWKINDRSPWNMSRFHKSEELLRLTKKQFFLHYNLIPYQYALMKEANKTGVPALRHLALEFPADDRAVGTEDEFMLGESLLIAPVLDDYIDEREIYLPAGNWYDLFTGERWESGTHMIALRRDRLPVFLRENGCVPLNLCGGKLFSDVGNGMDGYRELTFLLSGEGNYVFEDDIAGEISLSWDRERTTVVKNEKDFPFRVVRIGKDHLYDEEEL